MTNATPNRGGGMRARRAAATGVRTPNSKAAAAAPARGKALTRRDAAALAVLLKAVADPVRLQLLSMINSSESGEMCVCDLVAPLAVSQPTVSHHLRVLTTAGLLTRERRASWVWYRVVPDALERIRTLLP